MLAFLALTISCFATNPPDEAKAFFDLQISFSQPILTDNCGGDFNFDGVVNNPDALVMLSYFNTTTDQGCAEGDLDGDGVVTIHDVRSFLPNWGYLCN